MISKTPDTLRTPAALRSAKLRKGSFKISRTPETSDTKGTPAVLRPSELQKLYV